MTLSDPPLTARASWQIQAVGAFAILWNGFGCLDFIMTMTQRHFWSAQMGITEAQLAYVNAMPAWTVVAWGASVLAGALGGLLLLLRRRLALSVFVLSFLTWLAVTLHALLPEWMAAMWPMQALIGGMCLVFIGYAEVSLTAEARPKTPWHLWVVAALALLAYFNPAVDRAWAIQEAFVWSAEHPEGWREFARTGRAWLLVLWIVGGACAMAGGLLLLLRSRWAAPAFAITFIARVVDQASLWSIPARRALIDVSELVSAGAGFAFIGAFALYAWWMTKRGVLR